MLSEKLSRCPSARWADCCAQSFSRGRRNNAIRSLFVSSKRLINIGRLLDALVLSSYAKAHALPNMKEKDFSRSLPCVDRRGRNDNSHPGQALWLILFPLLQGGVVVTREATIDQSFCSRPVEVAELAALDRCGLARIEHLVL